MRIAQVTDLTAPFAIRTEVFVGEQGVTPAEEIDGMDDACLHWLATDEEGPVATLRVRVMGDTAKIQRVAVLPRARGTGVGAALMRHVMDELRASGLRRATLGAQTHAMGFYARLGFVARGPTYDDAGIPHRDMDRDL
ncbi:GNAT family N-acetyltransferase [Jannaschia rubra]|uniref:Putative N-acetyltransferase YjcF n=1 Tax=Jannaschia rubra TaxID=282197 RepID=A0A0M6XNC3_9RHOB|nr:GNAT family N-acetyltransferase [Jannaschia rubra]CTQ32646.1 putative N-acetyltransferase YjcF [Jannaschia rubra]SFF86662.1 ElaA protein [Jannaschia rubra]